MKQFNSFDWVRLILAGSIAMFILVEVTIMLIRPTNEQNIEIRKDTLSIINTLIGYLLGSAQGSTSKPELK